MTFISREQVLALLDVYEHQTGLREEIEKLFSFPASNPDPERNVMGQTEDEFWAAVDRD